ncbi:hypothetical protein ONZ45_g10009 [Pleurotus djamor]|nr:hypothetical protein ONZ45_g10009 [Pleurotus djamor]
MELTDARNDHQALAEGILKLPPEIVSQIFLLLADETDKDNHHLHLCLVCRSWLPSARAALYQSVILSPLNTDLFARTVEDDENGLLCSLVKQLTLQRETSQEIFWATILPRLAPHATLLALRLHANSIDGPEILTDIAKSAPFLRSLDVDTNVFPELHAMKRFIASFPQLEELEVNDALGGDFADEWYDESASGAHAEFPTTVRTLAFYVTGPQTLDALLRWVHSHTISSLCIRRFSIAIGNAVSEPTIGPLLGSFGGELRYLILDYRWPYQTPKIDLRANVNLMSLMLKIEVYETGHDLKDNIKNMLGTISSTSLHAIEFDLKLSNSLFSHRQIIDWESVDKLSLKASIVVLVCVAQEEKKLSVEEEIKHLMPQHLGQGKLHCAVSARRSW